MTYLTDKLTEALGGEARLRGAEGYDYANWSPQGVRRVAIFPDGIFVDYHKPYNKGRVKGVALDKSKLFAEREAGTYSKSNQLAPLTMKKFMTLEEIIVDASLNMDLNPFLGRIDSKSRLRVVSTVQVDRPGSQIVRYVKELADLRDAEYERYNSLWGELMPTIGKQSVPGPNAMTWAAHYTLTGRVYNADRSGGPLDTFFRAVAKTNGMIPDEPEIPETFNSKQEANILTHRANARKDIENLPVFETVANARHELKSVKSNAGFDAIGVKKMLQALRKIPADTGGIKGLNFYIERFGDEDNVNVRVSRAYKALNYLNPDEKEASTARIAFTGGYLPDEEILRKAIAISYKSREKRNLYVPDTDLFKPTLRNFGEWVSLLAGESFDYVGYSKELQGLLNDGDEGEGAVKELEQAKDRYHTDAAKEAIDQLVEKAKPAHSELKQFLSQVQKGTVNAAKTTYLRHGRTLATQGAHGGYQVAKVGVRAGVAYIGKGKPWGIVVSKFADKILDASDDAVMPMIYTMLSEIDSYAEGERHTDDSTLTPELEAEYKNIIDVRFGGPKGIDAFVKMHEYVMGRGGIREKQFERAARSSSGAPGFKEYIDKHPEMFSAGAKELFRKMHYLELSEADFRGLESCPLFDPIGFLDRLATSTLSFKMRIQGHERETLDLMIQTRTRADALNYYVDVITGQWGKPVWSDENRAKPLPTLEETLPTKRDREGTGRGLFGIG